jgi:hypothetical protein
MSWRNESSGMKITFMHIKPFSILKKIKTGRLLLYAVRGCIGGILAAGQKSLSPHCRKTCIC